MNTIEIVNDKIINSIDDTINVSLEEKTVFFDVKTIKINILKENYFLVILFIISLILTMNLAK